MEGLIVHKKNLTIVLGVAAALGGVAALLTYIEMRKTSKLKNEVLMLDYEIKQLELITKKAGTKKA